ncbi:hypothetical protein VXQ18_05320, partial [Brucella abortus]|nr:hypothetical protein [Brucella abortus]
ERCNLVNSTRLLNDLPILTATQRAEAFSSHSAEAVLRRIMRPRKRCAFRPYVRSTCCGEISPLD